MELAAGGGVEPGPRRSGVFPNKIDVFKANAVGGDDQSGRGNQQRRPLSPRPTNALPGAKRQGRRFERFVGVEQQVGWAGALALELKVWKLSISCSPLPPGEG